MRFMRHTRRLAHASTRKVPRSLSLSAVRALHVLKHSLCLACALLIPGYFNSFAGIREPLSICGRLPELPGDLGCLDPGVGWKRRSGQQEDSYHPPSPAAGGTQRRGAEQTHGPSDHRSGRRTAQHPGRAAAQEDRETRQNQINRF